MGFSPAFKVEGRPGEPGVGASIEYFAKPRSFDAGQMKPPDFELLKRPPDPKILPAVARFAIELKYDGDDIGGAEFTYVEKGGIEKHAWTIPVPPPSPPYPDRGIPKSVRAPIVAFQVDIVGRSGGVKALTKSGEGVIRDSAADAMTVVAKQPPSEGAFMAQTANSVYGQLPVGPSKTFTQTFVVDPSASK